jgi:hypothetical protein
MNDKPSKVDTNLGRAKDGLASAAKSLDIMSKTGKILTSLYSAREQAWLAAKEISEAIGRLEGQ